MFILFRKEVVILFIGIGFPLFGKPIPINTKTISSVQKMQRMLICEWFVYYGEIKDKLVLTVENIINNEYIRGRADRLFLADLFKRRSL
ncbi:hypothetical protein [Dialister invisus]|uniref:hypothetical protein n=1 Tax=Dialister invisus TaxID=218538 RepID=UPI003AB1943E